MAISVLVRTHTGKVLARSTHSSLGAVCRLAKADDLPLLGGVDPYDDTVFNRFLLPSVSGELDLLLAAAQDAGVREAIGEVLALVELVGLRPHRYLLFNGD